MKKIILSSLLFSSLALGKNTLYLGADLGVSTSKSSIAGEVGSKSGFGGDIKSYLNFELGSSFNSDLGLGYMYHQTKGSDNTSSVKITTKLLYGDADIKYNVTRGLSLGPVLNLFMGTNTDFTEVETGNKTNPFVGLKVAYKFDAVNPMRLDFRAITSSDEAKTIMALVGFSFGFDLNGQTSKGRSLKPEIMPPPELAEEEKPDLTFTLKSARVIFDTNVSDLDKDLEAKIKRLAKYLVLNGESYSKVKISGHTDKRGTRDYNLELSAKRAESVVQAFIKAGLDPKKISSRGYGFDRPRDLGNSAKALEKNRRTEIEFYGIKNKERFNNALIEILK